MHAKGSIDDLGHVQMHRHASQRQRLFSRHRQAAYNRVEHREIEVLRLITAGKSNQEIANELTLSVRTVERHISNIYEKIEVYGNTARAAATVYAFSHGLTQA